MTRPRVLAFLSLAFLLSGLSALVYELVWMQMLVAVFGVTCYAIVTIVTAFMAGMALGALGAGRLTDRGVSPLRLYVALELFVGVFALVFPHLVDALFELYPWIHARWELSFLSVSLVRFGVCFVVLLLPATAMGATLPLLAKVVVREREGIGRDVGLLYGLNTLGAAAGCVLTGYCLTWVLGLRTTGTLAAASTFAAAGIAAWLHWRGVGRDPAETVPEPPPAARVLAGPVLLALFFFSGFTSMAYALLWTRVFTMFHTNPQTAVFTLVLFLYLAGLGLGSSLYPRVRDRDPVVTFGLVQVAVAVLAVASLVGLGATRSLVPEVRPSLLESPLGTALFDLVGVSFFPGELLLAVAVVFLPGVLFGLVFPLGNTLYVQRLRLLGSGVGGVYFAIPLGGIAGPFVSGFFLMPLLSVKNALLVMVAVNLSAGAWVLWRRLAGVRGRWAVGGTAATVAAGVAWLAVAVPSWVFLPLDRDDVVLFYADGRNVSSGVVEKGAGVHRERVLYTSGERVTGFQGDIDLPLHLSAGFARTPRGS